jgi:SAM-dependent methyltransferase
MHAAAIALMKQAICRAVPCAANVLDVGSYDVNGTFRPLIESLGWEYTGLDIGPGQNVDIVAAEPYTWPIQDGTYKIVICGNMLHNTAEPWRLVPEMARVLQPGGLLVIVTVSWGKPNSARMPVDAWRFMPDGMGILFDLAGSLENYEICGGEQDIVASAFKRGIS